MLGFDDNRDNPYNFSPVIRKVVVGCPRCRQKNKGAIIGVFPIGQYYGSPLFQTLCNTYGVFYKLA